MRDELFRKLNPEPEDVLWLEELSCPELLLIAAIGRNEGEKAALRFEYERNHVPGLAISDLPRAFIFEQKMTVQAKKLPGYQRKVYQVFSMPAKWANRKAAWRYVPESFLKKSVNDWNDPNVDRDEHVQPHGWVNPKNYEVKPLKGWKYEAIAAKCAPGKEPSEYDLPNPRLYSLDGSMVYFIQPWWPHWIRGEFKRMVVDLFTDPKPLLFTTREPRLFAFLDYHKKNGGNPSAFVEYVRELTILAPTSFNAYLVDRLAYWVTKQPKRTKEQEPQQKLSDLLGYGTFTKLMIAMNTEFEGSRIISTDRTYQLGGTSKGALVAAVDVAFAHEGKSPPPDEEYRELLTREFHNFTLGKGKLHATRDTARAKKWKPVIAARLKE